MLASGGRGHNHEGCTCMYVHICRLAHVMSRSFIGLLGSPVCVISLHKLDMVNIWLQLPMVVLGPIVLLASE